MTINPRLFPFVGRWSGTSSLYLSPDLKDVTQSQSTAVVTPRISGQFIEIAYDWRYQDERQEGILVLGCDASSGAAQAVWTDSWHMSRKFMLCDGSVLDSGKISVKGFYSVPDQPDWGWRIEVAAAEGVFSYRMFNVTPDELEELASETVYTPA